MAIQIQIISVDVENKGKYQQAEVAYKDLAKGSVGSKKLMSFTNKDVYNTVTGSKKGDVFNVELVKNDKGYWDWSAISAGGDSKAAPTPAGNPSPKSNYETADERAKRQVYIVRQSSLGHAIDTLKTDKKNPSKEEVIELAKYYERYVFGLEEPATALAELPTFENDDDIPL